MREKDKFCRNIKVPLEDNGIYNDENAKEYYTAQEQIERVSWYIADDKSVEISNLDKDILPVQANVYYQQALETFLPQHPFLMNRYDNTMQCCPEFTGPAFRDYTVTKLIEKKEDELAEFLLSELENSKSFFPSKIFFDCYIYFMKNKVHLKHLALLYSAYCAKAQANDYAYMAFNQTKDEDGKLIGNVEFSMISGVVKPSKELKNNTLPFQVIFDEESTILQMDHLLNVSIDAPDITIMLGKAENALNIVNSSVLAHKICWCSQKVNISSSGNGGCILNSIEMMEGMPNRIEIDKEVSLTVSSPNVNKYYWFKNYKSKIEEGTVSQMEYVQALRSIIIEFRSHSKDTIAKDAERIDNVVIGRNTKDNLKARVLNQLLDLGIIYRKDHLYKVDGSLQDQWGIYQVAFIRNDINYNFPNQ